MFFCFYIHTHTHTHRKDSCQRFMVLILQLCKGSTHSKVVGREGEGKEQRERERERERERKGGKERL